jgi:hypothetical protein
MNIESKVLQISYHTRGSALLRIYAEEAETQKETLLLRNCRMPRTIRCGITGRDEFYADRRAEVAIPLGSARNIIEVETPGWWDTTREAVLTDLVWLNAKPWSSNQRVTISQLESRIAERVENWERSTTLASDIETTFFRDLICPHPQASLLITRLVRILPLLGSDDKKALTLAGLPGLGTNHALNHLIREWLSKQMKKTTVINQVGI